MLKTLLLALCLTLVSVLPVQAATFWDDELESGNTGYGGLLNVGPCGGLPSFEYDTVNKVSGAASLKENFPGTPQYHQLCGGFADRSFTPTTDLWGRFYIRLSPGFVVDATQTKIMRNNTDGVQSHWWGMLFGSNAISVQLQNYPVIGSTNNFYPNVGDGTLPRGQFVCIETRIKHNTVGQANGLIEAYKDGVRFMNHTGLEILKVSQGTQNARFVSNRMYRQDGGGSINYDRLAFGNTRIGCIGAPPAPDTLAPPQVSGLSATGAQGAVNLTWNSVNDASLPIDYLVQQASASGGPYSTSKTVQTTSTSVTGLANTTTYYFRIFSRDAVGNVATLPSAVASATTTTPSVGGSLSINSSGLFVLNGTQTFLLGISYFDATLYYTSDLDTLASRGFNLLRAWATWNIDLGHGGTNRSVCDLNGALKVTERDQLQSFINYAKTKNQIVALVILDVGADALMTTQGARTTCVTNVVNYYKPTSAQANWNVMFDVVQEHDSNYAGTEWAGSVAQVKTYTDAAFAACLTCIIFASATFIVDVPAGFPDGFIGPQTGSTLTTLMKTQVTNKVTTNAESVLAIHEARDANWHSVTGARVAAYRAHLATLGKTGVPVIFDEPCRLDFSANCLATEAEVNQAAGQAKAAGAAMWLLHNDASFDFRTLTLFQQLSATENAVTVSIAASLPSSAGSGTTPTVLAGSSDTFTRPNNADLGVELTPVTGKQPLNLVSNAVQATINTAESLELFVGTAATPASLYTCTGANEGPPPTGFLTKSGNGLKRISATSSCGWDAVSAVIDSIVWNTDFTDDQEVQATLAALPTGTNVDFGNLFVRAQATSGGYDNLYNGVLFANGTNYTMEINRFVAGVQTTLGAASVGTVSVNDVFLLRAVGSQITLYQNGVARVTATDTSFPTGGYIGMGSFRSASATQVRWKNFSGGNYTASFATPNNQGRTITLGTVGGSVKQYGGVGVRHGASTAWDGVYCELTTNPSTIQIRKRVANSGSDLTSVIAVSPAWTAGDVIGAFANGTSFYCTRGSVTSTPIAGPVTDSTYTAGSTSLYLHATSSGVVTNLTIASTDGYEYTTPPPACTPSITSAATDATGATVGWPSSCPPTNIRVRWQSGSLVEPISAFPGGRYTKVGGWPPAGNGAAFQCFDAIDAQGVVNTTTYVCTGFQPPYDDQPAILSNPQPTGVLPSGTTSRTISVNLNKLPTVCRTSTTDQAYSTMGTQMSIAGLTASYVATGLTDGGPAVRYFIRCTFTDVVEVEHPNTSSVFVDLVVAAASDTSPPTITGSSPSGSLPAGSTSTPVLLTTNENATCKGSLTAGVAYGSMAITFAGTGTTSHSHTYSGLTNGGSYVVYVRCTDGTNVSLIDVPITFTVDSLPPDVSPPNRTAGAPSGTRAAGTVSEPMSLTTDEVATCKYSVVPAVAYATMTNTFNTTGGTSHSTGITTGTDNQFYRHFIRCSDAVGNVNTTDFEITWFQDFTAGDVTAPTTVEGLVAALLPSGSETQVQLNWIAATDAGGLLRYDYYSCFVAACTPDVLAGSTPSGNVTTVVVAIPTFASVSFCVKAVDTSLNESAACSNVVTISTIPIVDATPPSDAAGLAVVNGPFSQSVVIGWTEGTDNLGPIITEVELCAGASCDTWTIVPPAATGTSALISNLTAATFYRLRVKHCDAAVPVSNCGAYSNILDITTTSTGLPPRLEVPFGVERPTTARPVFDSRPLRP